MLRSYTPTHRSFAPPVRNEALLVQPEGAIHHGDAYCPMVRKYIIKTYDLDHLNGPYLRDIIVQHYIDYDGESSDPTKRWLVWFGATLVFRDLNTSTVPRTPGAARFMTLSEALTVAVLFARDKYMIAARWSNDHNIECLCSRCGAMRTIRNTANSLYAPSQEV